MCRLVQQLKIKNSDNLKPEKATSDLFNNNAMLKKKSKRKVININRPCNIMTFKPHQRIIQIQLSSTLWHVSILFINFFFKNSVHNVIMNPVGCRMDSQLYACHDRNILR